MCGAGSTLESGRNRRECVCGGGLGAEGRLQAPLMVLVGEKSGGGESTLVGGCLERREGTSRCLWLGGGVGGGEVRNVQGLAACEKSHNLL